MELYFGVPLWQIYLILGFSFMFGLLKSGFGLGGTALTPILAMIIEPRFAIAVLGPLALWTDIAALRNHWGKWDTRIVKLGVPATVIGTLVGVFVLRGIPISALNKLLAVITLSYVVVQVARERRAVAAAAAGNSGIAKAPGTHWMASNVSAHVFAFGGGLIGTLSHAGGILITFYLLACGLRKDVYIATLVSLFFVQNIVKVPLYVGMGILSVRGFWLAVVAIPLVFAGGWVGKKLNARMSQKQFSLILNGLMLTAGILLLFK